MENVNRKKKQNQKESKFLRHKKWKDYLENLTLVGHTKDKRGRGKL